MENDRPRNDEASRAMAHMAPEQPGEPNRYGLFMQIGLMLASCRYGVVSEHNSPTYAAVQIEPMAVMALEQRGVYVVFNFMEQGVAYTIITPHGTAHNERLGFGRHVYRVRAGKLILAENGTFKRRWKG